MVGEPREGRGSTWQPVGIYIYIYSAGRGRPAHARAHLSLAGGVLLGALPLRQARLASARRVGVYRLLVPPHRHHRGQHELGAAAVERQRHESEVGGAAVDAHARRRVLLLHPHPHLHGGAKGAVDHGGHEGDAVCVAGAEEVDCVEREGDARHAREGPGGDACADVDPGEHRAAVADAQAVALGGRHELCHGHARGGLAGVNRGRPGGESSASRRIAGGPAAARGCAGGSMGSARHPLLSLCRHHLLPELT